MTKRGIFHDGQMTRARATALYGLAFALALILTRGSVGTGHGQVANDKQQQITRNELQSASIAGDALLEKARVTGAARVIAGLRLAFLPEGHQSRTAAQAQRRAIAQAQTRLLGRLATYQVTSVKRFDYIPFIALEIDAEGLERLRALPEVTSVEEDRLEQFTLAESTALIGAQAAWASGFSGAGQNVAILDTGVDKNHPFLAGKVVSEACYSTTNADTTSVCPGGVAQSTATDSGVNCSASLIGCDHGTHVAGTAAGKSASFSGVARDANIIAIQVSSKLRVCPPSPFPCVAPYLSDVLLGLQRVQALSSSLSIAAVNLSLGGGIFTSNCDSTESAYKMTIDNLRSLRIATIAASGNDGSNNAMSRPACISSAISVGSTGDGSNGSTVNAVSSFSNSASFLNLLAPGEWINSSVPGGGFANFRGTSMATPHVTGAVAVLKSKTPTASISQILQTLSGAGLPISDSRNSITKPRIRVDAAVSALSATPCNYSISPATQSFNTSGGAGTVNVTAGGGCSWTAASNVSWISVTSGASGSANGAVNFTVAANSGLERKGTLFVGGNTFIVTQAGAPTLAVDDGAFENSIGLGSGGTLTAVNRLAPSSYPAAINAVAVHFQSLFGVPAGTNVTILYGVNPSGGSDINSVVLQTVPGTVQSRDDFNVYPIPTLSITSGDFVIGFRISHSSSQRPVVQDTTAPSRRRSYLSSGGAFTLADDIGSNFAGNFGIRALLAPKAAVATGATLASESCAAPNQAPDPGETVTVNFELRNAGTESLNNLVATLQAGGGVSSPSGPRTYGAMSPGGPPVSQPFTFTVSGSCGGGLTATLQLQDGSTSLGTVTFSMPIGGAAPFAVNNNYSYTGSTQFIGSLSTIEVPITVTDPGIIGDVNVRLRLDHTFDGDLDIFLVGPDGTTVELSTDNGESNDNFGSGPNNCSGAFTVFDDSASAAITSGSAPFVGTFRPEGRLSDFNGKGVSGVWKLRISDDATGDSGTFGCWQLEIGRRQPVCCGSTCPVIASVNPASALAGSQVTISGTNFNGVNAVKFGNVSADFTVNSDSQITATVPLNARSGPLAISKSNCADFQINFTPLTLEIVAGGAASLAAESCSPVNQAIDPGESVTINFPIKNMGTGNTTNLVATLQPAGGVTSPGGPQNYGVVAGGGAAVSRPFTFTASGTCGGTLTATLQLQDGTTNLGTVTFTFTLGAPRAPLAENFDSVTAPALPAGWSSTVAGGAASPWATSTTSSDTAPNNAFVSGPDTVHDIRLESPSIAINTSSARLTFRNNYNLEAGTTGAFDGGALEIAIGSAAFTDILAAGGSFVTGGYNRTITASLNPLQNRQVWSSNSAGYITTTVNLPAAAAGQNVRLRWRFGSDSSASSLGWHIDTITISDGVVCSNCSVSCQTVSGLNPASGAIGSTVTITGANFTGVNAVKFTGNASAQFTVNSGTQITATVPNGAASGPITISKPGCADLQTGAFTIRNPAPEITNLAPSSAVAGSGALTLTVTGTGFINASIVRWNGNDRSTTFFSSTQLRAAIPASDLATPGTASVTVVNPAPGGGSSGALNFTIQPNPRIVRVATASGAPGAAVNVPIELVSQGDENAVGFSLSFDTAVLSNPQAALGSDAANAQINTNGSQAAQGRFGLSIALPTNQRFAAGVRQIATATFTIAANALASSTPINFGDQPILREISDANASPLPANYTAGAVSITQGYEADVAPRPNGNNNGTVTVTDWTQVGRFVAGLDTAANGSEFQRADCAPRAMFGDGRLATSDWVQAGRYAAGEDPVVASGGPTSPVPSSTASAAMIAARAVKHDEVRLLRVIAGDSPFGTMRTLMIELDAQGDENALGFSLLFNPSEWRFVSAEPGRDARQAVVHVNANEAASGQIGFALALPSGRRFDTGARQVLALRFAPVSGAEFLAVGFADEPVTREVVSYEAIVLPARYQTWPNSKDVGALVNVSAASMLPGELASGQIVAAYGENLAAITESAADLPLPSELGGARALITDSKGVERWALLLFASPKQINYLLPEETAEGVSTVKITNAAGAVSAGLIEVTTLAPGLFTANSDGYGAAAAVVLRIRSDGAQSFEPVAQFDAAQSRFVAAPIDLGTEGDQVFLLLFGTGIRGHGALEAVKARIGGADAEVLYAGPQGRLVGVDQTNIRLPRDLAGRGDVDVVLTADGKTANTVRIAIK